MTVGDAQMMRDIIIPPLAECHHYVNLTNGLEAIPHLRQLQLPYAFTRIQSTYCEQQKWDELVIEADPNLMMSMAMGNWYASVILFQPMYRLGQPECLL